MNNYGILIHNITKTAGTERAVSNLANILSEKGDSVFIISIDSTSGDCPFYLNNNINIIHCGQKVESHNIKDKIKSYRWISKNLQKICNDNNITCVIGTLCLYNIFISKLKNVKTIGCEHFNYDYANKVYKVLRKKYYKKLNAVVVLTERDAKKYNFLNNVYVIPNSFSFNPSSKSTCENKEIISLGRLNYQKGYDMLVEIAAKLKDRIPDWHISIYGEGEDYDMLTEKIYSLDLQGFITIKPYTNETEKVYSSAGFYVSSSRFEGLPMVLIEAQLCGLPIVSFDCDCGPSDVITEGVNGYLIKPGDFDSFANKVVELACNLELRKSMGDKSVEIVKKFSTENVRQKWNKLFEII